MKNIKKIIFKENSVNINIKYFSILFVLFALIVINLIEKKRIITKEKNNKFGNKCY